MEASAVHAPAGLARLPLGLPLLRLRSDEQLVALFRAGNDDAFGVIHDRYRQRLFAYVRQMLSAGPRQDAEDVLQDVFVRAYGALRADRRAINLRAWLYRVAHNRCIDHLRRPVPPPAEIFDVSRKPLHDPVEEAQRREDLARLVQDVARLPEQQRSALLMREIDGLSYADLAGALDVTVPAVKSLLVRARIGLVDAAEARDADCEEIRTSLIGAYDRGVKASAHARRHLRTCEGCREFRTGLRGMRRSFAALSPVAFGPLALGAKLAGLAGGGGAAAGGSAAAGGGAAAAGGVATVSACKVAAVVCTAALTGGAAVEVRQLAREQRDPPARSTANAAPPAAAPAAFSVAPARTVPAVQRRAAAPAPAERGEPQRRSERRLAAKRERPEPAMTHTLPPPVTKTESEPTAPVVAEKPPSSGGAQAPPDARSEPPAAGAPETAAPAPAAPAPTTGTVQPPPTTSSSPDTAEPAPAAPPPPEH